MVVDAGNPVMLTVKFAELAVIVPAASRVMTNSIVAVPLALDSALEMGTGVSCEGDIAAVNRVMVVPEVDEGVELLDEQPTARRSPNTAIERGFMCCVTPIRRISVSG